jgi:hypothetical protein
MMNNQPNWKKYSIQFALQNGQIEKNTQFNLPFEILKFQ